MNKKWQHIMRNHNVISLSGNVLSAGLGFLSFGLLARLLDQSQFGSWFLFLTIFTFVEMLRTGLSQTSLVKFLSGTEAKQYRRIAGAGWVIVLFTTLVLSSTTLIVGLALPGYFANEGFNLFFQWFGWIFLATLPFNMASWLAQANQRFDRIFQIRLLSQGLYVLVLVYAFTLPTVSLSFVMYGFLAANGLTSLYVLLRGWSQIGSLFSATKKQIKALLQFGKYSMGTMIGSNLLRSSDSIIIGMLLSSREVALYGIPLKIIEVIEIPIRSFVATALPAMSRLVGQQDEAGLKKAFAGAAGFLSFALIPVALVCVIFAEPLVHLLGGAEYTASANILRIFAIYAIFIPLDRYSGVTLDVINKPAINFVKVLLMVLVNVGGDVLVLQAGYGLMGVALVSIATFLTGVFLGLRWLHQYTGLRLREIIVQGWQANIMRWGQLKKIFKTSA